MTKLLLLISRSKLWKFIASKIIAKISWGGGRIPHEEYNKMMKILDENQREGFVQCFVSRHRRNLGAVLIGFVSKWTHCGFLWPFAVASHMRSSGWHVEILHSLLDRVDDFAIIEFPVKSYLKLELAFTAFSVSSYDWGEELENGALIYCGEAIYIGIHENGKILHTSKILGRDAFSPDDVYNQGKVLYEYTYKGR